MTSLTKFCLHWTAGSNKPCETDLQAYHYCVDKYGRIFAGVYEPKDNIDCYDGKYAKHCGGGNTGCIGLSVCGMAGFDLSKKQTKYPLTQKQIENVVSILENIARQAVNNVRGQVAAETGREATQVPTRNAGRDYSEYDSEVVGGISNHNIDETELLNYANDMSNKLGMNLGDTNKRFVEEFIQKAGGFVGERWDNSIANLDDLAVLVANNLRGQIAAETGEETTQVPNRNFGL